MKSSIIYYRNRKIFTLDSFGYIVNTFGNIPSLFYLKLGFATKSGIVKQFHDVEHFSQRHRTFNKSFGNPTKYIKPTRYRNSNYSAINGTITTKAERHNINGKIHFFKSGIAGKLKTMGGYTQM
jgi:hypothetical protein